MGFPFGRYELFERLGVGALAEVYRAKKVPEIGPGVAFGPFVALKKLFPTAAEEPEVVEAFHGEAELLQKLRHPGISRVIEHGEFSGHHFIVYQIVEGRDLGALLSKARKKAVLFDFSAALSIAIDVLGALEQAHQLPVVHRDVSPSNVLVGFDGGVRLIDFGIAHLAGRTIKKTHTGLVKGTVRYMSPEQVLGIELDQRSDIYAVGVMLFEMLAGVPLRKGKLPAELMQEIASAAPTVAELSSRFDSDLVRIFVKVLAQNRRDRYDTAARFSEALAAYAESHRVPLGRERVERLIALVFEGDQSQGERESLIDLEESVGRESAPGTSGATFEESRSMADEKGGSDLDVFEGLAKKSVRSPAAGPSAAVPSAAVPPPPDLTGGDKRARTLLGVPPPAQAPAGPPPPPGPPSAKAPPPPPPKGASSASIPAVTTGPASNGPVSSGPATQLGLGPSSTSTPVPPSVSKPPPPPAAGGPASAKPPPPPRPPSKPPAKASDELTTPPPPSIGAPDAKVPASQATLVAAVAPPAASPAVVPPPPAAGKPAGGFGATIEMKSSDIPDTLVARGSDKSKKKKKQEEDDESDPGAGGEDAPTTTAASVHMDWEDDEESTHVFEKQKHGNLPKPSMPKKKDDASRAAAALAAGSGGAAAAAKTSHVPPPANAPVPATVVGLPVPLPPPARMPSDLAGGPSGSFAPGPLSARPSLPLPAETRSGSSGSSLSRIGLVLSLLAFLGVAALVVYMFIPRTGQLKIDVKTKSGKAIAHVEIFVDGQKKCETTPCVVLDLPPGSKSIKASVGDIVSEKEEKVLAGQEVPVFLTIDDSASVPVPVPVPTTPAPVAAGTGFKVSGQNGVKVTVDGKDSGVIPVTLTTLTAGDHKVHFDAGDDYAALDQTVHVNDNNVADLGDVKLKVLKGKLTLDLKTTGAEVTLTQIKDGKKIEKRLPDSVWKTPPVKIPIDTKDQWSLTATKKGMEDFKQDIKFDDGTAEKTVEIDLSTNTAAPTTPATTPSAAPVASGTAPAPAAGGMGTLNINSIPTSKVLLDGAPIGSTPIMGRQVTAGPHTVIFVSDKGRKSKGVTVEAGKTATAAVKFD